MVFTYQMIHWQLSLAFVFIIHIQLLSCQWCWQLFPASLNIPSLMLWHPYLKITIKYSSLRIRVPVCTQVSTGPFDLTSSTSTSSLLIPHTAHAALGNQTHFFSVPLSCPVFFYFLAFMKSTFFVNFSSVSSPFNWLLYSVFSLPGHSLMSIFLVQARKTSFKWVLDRFPCN